MYQDAIDAIDLGRLPVCVPGTRDGQPVVELTEIELDDDTHQYFSEIQTVRQLEALITVVLAVRRLAESRGVTL